MNWQDAWKNQRIIFVASGAAIIIALAVFGYFYSKKSAEQSAISAERQKAEEKQKILEALSAPREDAPEVTVEERQKILESLSAPQSIPKNSVKSSGSKETVQTPVVNDEERQKILESLSAPQ